MKEILFLVAIYILVEISKGRFIIKFSENSNSCGDINSSEYSQVSHFNTLNECSNDCYNINDFWISKKNNEEYIFNFNSNFNTNTEYELKYKLSDDSNLITHQMQWWKINYY